MLPPYLLSWQALLLTGLMGLTACAEKAGDTSTGKGSPEADSSDPVLAQLVEYGIDTSALIPQGLAAGQRAPLFQARTQQGDSIRLRQLLNQKPVVLMFYRGQWCPVCNQYLQRLEDSVKLIRQAGARVLAVTPETAPNAAKMRRKSGSSVTIIPDTAETIIGSYNVGFEVNSAYARKIEQGLNVSIAENNGARQARLPIPATYIIDQDGRIAWQFFNPDYRKRASVKAILANLPDSAS